MHLLLLSQSNIYLKNNIYIYIVKEHIYIYICLSKLFNLSMLRILKFGILVDTEILKSEWVNINLITFICQY